MEDTRSVGEAAPAVSARITPDHAQYDDLVQRLFLTNESLTQNNRELADLDQLKVNLMANVGLELRAALGTLVGMSALLGDESLGRLNPAQKDCVERITEGGKTLLRAVTDLLVWSQLEEGELMLHRETVSLSDVVRRTLKELQPLLDAKGHHVEIRLDLPLPEIHADAERLVQALGNLLDNACRFTAAGGHLAVHCRHVGDSVVIEVCDDGIGIAPEHMARIFDRHYQVRDQRANRSGGSGLGLSIVKRLVELHDGSVTVDSTPGRGSHFRVRLPVTSP